MHLSLKCSRLGSTRPQHKYISLELSLYSPTLYCILTVNYEKTCNSTCYDVSNVKIMNYAPSGASKTEWDTDRTSVQANIGSAVAETLGPMSKCWIQWEVIIVQRALDMNRESAEYELSASLSATMFLTVYAVVVLGPTINIYIYILSRLGRAYTGNNELVKWVCCEWSYELCEPYAMHL